jgi:hypothetical protein
MRKSCSGFEPEWTVTTFLGESSVMTEVFPCFSLSCKANARV